MGNGVRSGIPDSADDTWVSEPYMLHWKYNWSISAVVAQL